MNQLQDVLMQPTPWGLTIGQTVALVLGMVAIFVVASVLGFVLRIFGVFMRVGCLLVVLFGCGCGATMFLMNNLQR
jgi:hypothetical protein